MAVRIVDLLEKIEIDDDERERPLVALRFLERARQLVLQMAMVVELRQSVRDRQELEPAIRFEQLFLQIDDPLRRPNPRHQLGILERLGDVVVRAEVEALDLVLLIVLAGEHDDVAVAQLGIGLELLAEIDAIHVGQAAIEDRQVPGDLRQLLPRLLAHPEFDALVPAAPEQQPHEPANSRIVIDDRNLKGLRIGHWEIAAARVMP